MTTQTPEEFDFNDWFGDANLPEASADIFTQANLLSELSDLERRIKNEAAVKEAEPTAASKSRLSELENEYVQLAQQFTDSKVTVYVRALPSSDRKNVRAAHDEAQKRDGESDAGFVQRIVAASIIGMKKAGEERKPASLSFEQVKDLTEKLGDMQIKAIFDAQATATNGIPRVDADFLRKLSGPADGQES